MLRSIIRRLVREDKKEQQFQQLEKQLDLSEPEYLTPGDDEPDDEEEEDYNVDFYLPRAESRLRGLIRMLLEAVCPDCKGSGEYVGFLEREKCKTCGGSGEISDRERSASKEEPIGSDLTVGKKAGTNYIMSSSFSSPGGMYHSPDVVGGPYKTEEMTKRRIRAIDHLIVLVMADAQNKVISDQWLEKTLTYNLDDIDAKYGNAVAHDISTNRIFDYMKFRLVESLRQQGITVV